MASPTDVDICGRISQVREELTGPRGRAAFAQMLGIASSTYQNYESSRVPPAGILLRIADVAGVDLHWLLTGRSAGATKVPPEHPVLRRAADLLDKRPDAAKPLAAFLEILSAALEFPAKTATREAAQSQASAGPQLPAADAAEAHASWIPILGRSAAGVPHFWASGKDAAGVTMLDDMVERCAARSGRTSSPAAAAVEAQAGESSVQIVTLPAPAEGEVAEFVSAPSVKARYADAFALRIDGESMAPEIDHGDLVILSPSIPAVNGRPAVVQLDRQIGVTCKLFRREGRTAHLVPINEAFGPQSFPAAKVVWALRVLARVRSRPK